MSESRAVGALACAVVAWMAGSATLAVSVEDQRMGALTRGALLYRAHCSVCHGVEGRGDGRLAGELQKPPSDLTRLRREGDGEFPADRVRRLIDGRQELAGHAPGEMPVWGLTFLEHGRTDDQGGAAEAMIDDLVVYLRSIQTGER